MHGIRVLSSLAHPLHFTGIGVSKGVISLARVTTGVVREYHGRRHEST